MKKENHIKVLEFWTRHKIPYVWDETLSLYQLVRKTIQYLNKVIEDQNELKDIIKEFIKAFDEDLQDTVIKVLEQWKDDGSLKEIINEALFESKLDKEEYYKDMRENKEFFDKTIGKTFTYVENYKNDSNTWDQAINNAINSDRVGKVVLPAGEITIHNTIELKEGVSIVGRGKDKTIIVNNSGKPAIRNKRKDGVFRVGHIKDLHIRGNGSIGVLLSGAEQIKIENVKITGSLYGVYISYSWIISLENVYIDSSHRSGVYGSKEYYEKETGKEVNDDQNHIKIYGGCQFLGNNVGVELNGGINNTIVDSDFEGNINEALIVRGLYNFQFERNYLEHNSWGQNGRDQIVVDDLNGNHGFLNIFNSNRIYGYIKNTGEKSTYGMRIESGYNIVVSNNSFSTHFLGHIKIKENLRVFLDNNYFGDNNKKVVGKNWDGYRNGFGLNQFRFNSNSGFDKHIVADYDNLFINYPSKVDGKFEHVWVEFNGVEYENRTLNKVQSGGYLPKATDYKRGELFLVKGNTDRLYICKQNNGNNEWVEINVV